jgi:UDP-N-acetylmuramoylalanine--D-glutamate ligase
VATDYELWVIEVSSYQATDIPVTPPVTGVTSLHADHLDWHQSVEAYYRDKLSLTSQPGARVTVCGEDAELRRHEAQLGPTVRWVDAPDAGSWWQELGLVGRHNAVNAAVAARLLAEAGVTGANDPAALAKVAGGFTGLDSRLKLVATVGGVEFFDDSLSTNVLPTIAAIDSFPARRIAVILGGFDRGIDYRPLVDHLAARDEATLALTVPDNGERIATAIETLEPAEVELIRCEGLADAVARGFRWAHPNGVVLLSPAAPSFGQFRDYRQRAASFTAAALACRP